MEINIGTFSGTAEKIAELTSKSGNGYLVLDLVVQEYDRSHGQHPVVYSFNFFREQAEAIKATVQRGDYVLVYFKLMKNQKGYLDMRTTGFQILRKAQAQPSASAYPQAQAQVTFQAAPSYQPPPPADNTPF